MVLLLIPFLYAENLSLTEALARAEQNNPEIRQLKLQEVSAQAAIRMAQSPFDPTFNVASSYGGSQQQMSFFGFSTANASRSWDFSTGVSAYFATGTGVSAQFGLDGLKYLSYENQLSDQLPPDAYSSSLTLSLSQNVLQGFGLRSNLAPINAARSALSVAQAQAQATRQQTLAAVSTAYWNLYYQQNLLLISEDSLKLVQEQARIVAALAQDGRVAPVELLRVQAAEAEAQQAVLIAQLALKSASDSLLLLLGSPPGTPLQLSSLPPPASPPQTEGVLAVILENNPQILSLKLSIQNQEANVREARHACLPQLQATASYGLSGYEEEINASLSELGSGDLSGWAIGATLSVPLLNRQDQGALDRATAELSRLQIQEAALQNSLQQQALALLGQLDVAYRRLDLMALDIRLQQASLEAEEARFREGRSLQKDVLTALSALKEARVTSEKAQIDYANAKVQLDALMGRL